MPNMFPHFFVVLLLFSFCFCGTDCLQINARFCGSVLFYQYHLFPQLQLSRAWKCVSVWYVYICMYVIIFKCGSAYARIWRSSHIWINLNVMLKKFVRPIFNREICVKWNWILKEIKLKHFRDKQNIKDRNENSN